MRQALVKAIQKKIEDTRDKIIQDQILASVVASSQLADGQPAVEAEYCPICYTNEISTGDAVSGQTVELACKHRFCSDCTIESLRGLIETADLKKLKCFDHECAQAIEDNTLRDILTRNSQSELYEKYKRFVKQSNLDADPLIRWCPKPECGRHIRADSLDVQLVICPDCST